MCAAMLLCAAGAHADELIVNRNVLSFGPAGASDEGRVGVDDHAATDAATDPTFAATSLSDLVAKLDSDDILERDRITQRLIASKAHTFAQIEEQLRSPDLSAEQRLRLMRVAKEKFAGTPRAAMGVQFDNFLLPTRVVIGKTFEPFASSTMLEEGDMIVEAAGLPTVGLGARNMLRSVILAHEPGDKLPITVRRGSEKVKLELPLGNFGDLQNGRMDPGDVERAWRIHAMLLNRSIREKAAAGSTIETGMKPIRPLTEGEYRQQQQRLADERTKRMQENPEQAERDQEGVKPIQAGGAGGRKEIAGGENVGMGDGNVWVAIDQKGQLVNLAQPGNGARQAVQIRWIVGGPAGMGGMGGGGWGDDPFDPQTSRPEPSPTEELASLMASFEAQQKSLEGLDPALIERGDPQMIRDQRGQIIKQMRMLERQIKAIQAEINEQTAVSTADVPNDAGTKTTLIETR